MIAAKDISVIRDGRHLLQEVSLSVAPSEVVALVGPNGAGKTSLVRVLSGEWTPDEGQVELEGRPLHAYGIRDLARRRAVLGQDLSLAFPFTAFEIVMLGRIPYESGWSQEKNEGVALQAMRLTEAELLVDRLYTTLSGGERQRVQLARVLAQIENGEKGAGRFLFMDEPTANQDLAHQHLLLSLARDRASHHVGILIVLHDLNLAARYADRLVVLNDGRRVAEGRPEEVLTAELVADVFGITVRVLRHPADGRPLVVAD